MTEALASKTCTPCRGGIPPLTREQAELFHAQAPDWQLPEEAHPIGRSFRFRNFREALTFLPNIRELTHVEIPWKRILRQSPHRLLGIIGDRECCAPAYSREASCPSLNVCHPSLHSLQLSAPFVRSARPR